MLPSDIAFEVFLATILPSDLNDWEYKLYQFHKLHSAVDTRKAA